MFKLQKKPPALKRGHPTLQNMNFYIFSYFCGSFLPSWIRNWIWNSDPDPLTRLNPDPIRIRIQFGSGSATLVDTGDKFIASDNDTREQLQPLTTTPVINLLPMTMMPVRMKLWAPSPTSQPEILPFWFELVLAASGPRIRVFGGSNQTIGGRVWQKQGSQ